MTDFVHAAPRVVPYDPAWATAFADEAALLGAALAGVPHRVEHIGSTAVPGLPAKPVVDVMVGLPDDGTLDERFDDVRAALEHLAYVWDPRAHADDPGRHVFRKGPGDPAELRSHHLHLTVEGSGYWRRILAFRDRLRADPAAAAEYAAVKLRLLATCGGDTRAYTRGKTDVVRRYETADDV
ncbi:MAG: GrpB family protein [Actinobacteria bacterium]|nr:GrpB family protein [Actinomycetota bacterium]